jgi:hypothetical protein
MYRSLWKSPPAESQLAGLQVETRISAEEVGEKMTPGAITSPKKVKEQERRPSLNETVHIYVRGGRSF